MNLHLEPGQIVDMMHTKGIPWGRVLGQGWSTDRWVDNYPISLWAPIRRLASGGGWSRTENMHLLKPGEPGYDPTTYPVTWVL